MSAPGQRLHAPIPATATVIDRRRFVISLGAWLAPARTAWAQGKVHRIGFLGGGSASGYARHMDALRLGLRDHGYVEGRNVAIEVRWAEGKYDRLAALARDLVGRKVDVIVTQGTPAALVAKQTTSTIPIVMAIVGNPVETGIVASLARPGGNITGSSFFYAELNAKRLEILKEALPPVTRVAVLMNPDNPAMTSVWRLMEERARSLNLTLWRMDVRKLDELEASFVLARARAEALTIVDEGLFIANAGRVAELAMRHRLPGVGFQEYGRAGGLISYAVDFLTIWRRSMDLVDKIFKGAKPADLPVQQATSFELGRQSQDGPGPRPLHPVSAAPAGRPRDRVRPDARRRQRAESHATALDGGRRRSSATTYATWMAPSARSSSIRSAG